MRVFDTIPRTLTFAAAASLTACVASHPLAGVPNVTTNARPATAKNLYVANDPEGGPGSVTVYVPGTSTPARTITDGLCFPSSLTFDSSNNLYVTNDAHNLLSKDGRRAGAHERRTSFCGPSVTVYAPGTTTPSQTFTKNVEDPFDVVTDAAGFTYIANSFFGSHTGNLVIYKSGAFVRKITKGLDNPTRLVLDGTGTLYVANDGSGTSGGSIAVFTGKGKNRTLARSITTGVNYPVSLAVDSANNLYVGDYRSSVVTVYAPGASAPSRTITNGIVLPFALAFDASNNLYVANDNTVTVYTAGTTTLLRTISNGTTAPYGLAFGSNAYLNVANLATGKSTGSVTVYTPAENKLSRTITSGIANPVWIGFGP